MKKVPTIEPSYLTKKNLWDSSWLEEKYPERFKAKKNERQNSRRPES